MLVQMALKLPAAKAAEVAIGSIGRGYDISADLRLKFCKGDTLDSHLIVIDEDHSQEIALPGGISVPNVPNSIKCDKGERTRFRSDVLSFQQMSEQFNQEISLTGKIPSGLFNSMFDFSGCWQKDAAYTKTLAFDGVFITLYTVALEKSQLVLCDHVKQAVPSSWEPAALARFIEMFGTHIIVGVKMGGKDVVCVKQQHSSHLQPAEVQKKLKEIADKRFLDANGQYDMNSGHIFQDGKFDVREQRLRFADMSPSCSYSHKEDITTICKRRGGNDNRNIPHHEWLQTVQSEPDVISMSFIPITSLLNGVPGSGFLSHAINLYLRYKPPLEELHQFLEFQLPRTWAPVFSELPLGPQRRQQNYASLQFSFMGPKLYVNTTPVDVGKRPVTGLRLYLEGRKSNRVAIHLQHLSSLPKIFQLNAQVDGFNLENDNKGTVSISVSSITKRLTKYYVLTYDGRLLEKDWQDDKKDWKIEWNSLESECDIYGKCGEFGSCNSNSLPICSCLRGFQPRNDQEWSAGNWSSGCVRRTPLQCANIGGEDDGFSRLRNVKVPDDAEWLESYDEEDCRRKCLRNCSCLAYAYTLGFGCMIWNGSLIDVQNFAPVGPDIFIRLAHSEIGNQQKQQPKQAKTRKRNIILVVMVIIGITTAAAVMYFVWRWMRQRNGVMRITSKETLLQNTMLKGITSKAEVGDLPVFGLKKLAIATDNFQDSNKLGRGGFGTVYKGKFEDGQEIAVKRLSKASGQGLEEFMTEVLVISKLQHRNLVKLLGCCVEGEEKMLVYELMPNKSLDALLFDPTYQKILDWEKRLNIILGICRGLLYLHRDSRLRIIHRDLKASNILLDGNLNPKISDFGMARIFGGNQDQGDTNRIVGTYGYMSPEYAMEGRFSEKSDVFSFGVLLLEVLSGRRNSSFKDEECSSLLGHAWNLWNDDNILSLIDPTISESTRHAEILKCIQLGLLCVQEVPEDRPSVSMVISMIESQVTDLPHPTQPGFTQRRIASHNEAQQNAHEYCSVDRASITVLSGR